MINWNHHRGSIQSVKELSWIYGHIDDVFLWGEVESAWGLLSYHIQSLIDLHLWKPDPTLKNIFIYFGPAILRTSAMLFHRFKQTDKFLLAELVYTEISRQTLDIELRQDKRKLLSDCNIDGSLIPGSIGFIDEIRKIDWDLAWATEADQWCSYYKKGQSFHEFKIGIINDKDIKIDTTGNQLGSSGILKTWQKFKEENCDKSWWVRINNLL